MNKIFEKFDVLDRHGNPRKMHKEIKNPSQCEKWFMELGLALKGRRQTTEWMLQFDES